MSRARKIVRLAATLTEIESVRIWLHDDSRGFWEREAGALLTRANPAMVATMSEDAVDLEAAKRVCWLALRAEMLTHEPLTSTPTILTAMRAAALEGFYGAHEG